MFDVDVQQINLLRTETSQRAKERTSSHDGGSFRDYLRKEKSSAGKGFAY
jgi:hypothetical protein